jgi:hypothetical protein
VKYAKVILLSILVTPSFAQSESDWKQGSVVLINNQVLVGDIMLHLDFNTLLIKDDGHVTVLPARKVNSFRFYDEPSNINRQFLTIGNRTEDIFYELVLKGSYKVVRKLKRVHEPRADDKEDYEYFIMSQKEMVPIEAFKKKIFPLLVSSIPELEEWVELENLKLNTPDAAILIMKEFNNQYHARHWVASR